ncbi:hypothetical protein L3X38_005117 [Prunus dulcis]|uniref:Uncharacterized protein n=1 Tax=Prunus dulcis TaxID=3755 RepID=A0AAD4ZQA7_PRUDU|nr:hypothetical protein L3X38_005117 [Prunus dulcis]
MVVMDEMPFSVVEGKGFRRFCNSLNPNFQVPSRRTLVTFHGNMACGVGGANKVEFHTYDVGSLLKV